MTRYASGRRKEYAAVAILRALGWHATRSAGSHGLWDVVAAKKGQRVRLIQVKYTSMIAPWEPLLAPASVVDKNAEKLHALQDGDGTPVDAELWVFYRGRARPDVFAPLASRWHIVRGALSY